MGDPAARTMDAAALDAIDFPIITPDRWLADLDRTEIRESVRPLILKDNAVRLLGLGG